jgi:hypothetical protein
MSLYMIMLVFACIFQIYLLYMRENMWPLTFWAWFISLNLMPSNYTHLPSNHMSSFLMAEKNMYISYMFLIHSLVVRHLSCFHSLAIVNSAVMNIDVQMSLLYSDLCSCGHITGSHGYLFHFLRNHHTTFHNGCTYFYSHQQCISVPVSLHPHQHLLLLLPLNMTILTGIRWTLSVVLICISFIARKVEQFILYLLAIYISFFENWLFNSCAHFFTGMLILGVEFFEFPVDSGY